MRKLFKNSYSLLLIVDYGFEIDQLNNNCIHVSTERDLIFYLIDIHVPQGRVGEARQHFFLFVGRIDTATPHLRKSRDKKNRSAGQGHEMLGTVLPSIVSRSVALYT